MNKQQERSCLEAVFPTANLQVVAAEEPDFLCETQNGYRFGVEITEFYQSESDARLARIDSYAADLLAGGAYRHKEDRANIKTTKATYRPRNSQKGIPLTVIARDVPSHRDTVPMLLAQIEAKNAKYTRYAANVSPVDLIVDDVDRILRFESLQQLMAPLASTDSLRSSSFREIYVLTWSANRGSVAVPLRANLFAADIALFDIAYSTFRRQHGEPDTVRDFLSFLSVALAARFPDVRFDVIDGEPRYICASIAWTLNSRQEVRFIDISYESLGKAEPILSRVDGQALPAHLESALSVTRQEVHATYDLYFPVRHDRV